uniref:Uncharacterized protein n=1 Tax=Arundo donax TaxID=35708 RepID=A0A0A9GWR2_ARUDO
MPFDTISENSSRASARRPRRQRPSMAVLKEQASGSRMLRKRRMASSMGAAASEQWALRRTL